MIKMVAEEGCCFVEIIKDKARLYKHVKTLFVCAAAIGFGLSWSLLGPTIPDLCLRMGITVKEISWALSLRSFITMATCPLIGALLEKVQRQDLVIGVAMGVLGVTRIVIPFCKVLWIYGIAAYFEILCYNTCEIAIDILLLNMWGKDADPSISAWHLSFCIGFALGPLVVMPFLIDEQDIVANLTASVSNTTQEVKSQVSSPIEYPYIIIGIYCAVIAIIGIIFYIMPNPTKNQGSDDNVKKKKTSFRDIVTFKELKELDTPKCTLASLCFFFWLYYFCAGGLGGTFHTFLFTYCSVSSLGFSKNERAMIDFANKLALVVGRLLTTPMSNFISVQILIFIEVFGAFIFILPLMFLAEKAKIYLWVFTILFNIFLAPEWGSGISWMDKYVPLSSSIMTLVILAESISMVVFQYASGAILTDYSAMHLMYMFVAIGALHCIVLVIMQIIASKQGSRFNVTDSDESKSQHLRVTKVFDEKEVEAFINDTKGRDSIA